MRVGGAEAVVVEHARHAGPGFEVLVCALNGGGPALEAAAACGARTFVLAKSGRHAAGLNRLASLMRAEGVTVVNGHNPTGGLYAVLAARWAGVPAAVRTEHSIHYRGRHSRVYPVLERLCTALADRVVCVCEAVRESHASRMRWAAGRFVTVPNGVSDSRPAGERADLRSGLGLAPAECVVLTVGSLTRQKAYHVLLDAFAAVVREHPQARLLIAGDGPLKRPLEERAAAVGVTSQVRWLGPRTDVGDLVHAADLFTLSSEREGLPLSLLEAMRGARAAVVTRVGGNAEALVEGETGHLVPPHDPAALAHALSRLVADPERREAFGRAARERWSQRFTAERMVRDTESLYRAALLRRGHPAGASAAAERRAHASP
jgi:glycosyltransferase involved in cell wall biosynthesis